MKTCQDIMTKNPTCISPNDTLESVARVMRDENIGSLLVCEAETKKLLGIITDRDITVKCVAEGSDPRRIKIESLMTSSPVTCHEEDDVEKAVELMEEHQVRRLPIVDTQSRIVGIISQADIATRIREAQVTAKVVDKISQPPSDQYLQEHSEL